MESKTPLIAITGFGKGVHIGYGIFNSGSAFGTLCGWNNCGLRGDEVGPLGQFRGPMWEAVTTTEVSCPECFAKAEELHRKSNT